MKLVYPIEQEDGAAMTYELQGSDKASALFGGWNNVCLNFAIAMDILEKRISLSNRLIRLRWII